MTVTFHQSSGAGGSGNLTGHGSPEGAATATPGKGYVDVDTGDFYVKETGSGDTGWVLVGSSGGKEVYVETTADRDAITPAGEAVCFLKDSTPKYQLSLWDGTQWL